MTAVRLPGSDDELPPERRSLGPGVVVLLVSLMFLLVGFSIAAVVLHQPALAAVAVSAAVGLVGETVRRLLPGSVPPPTGPPLPSPGEVEPPPKG